MNSSPEHRHQTRSLCNHDGVWQLWQHSVNMSEYRTCVLSSPSTTKSHILAARSLPSVLICLESCSRILQTGRLIKKRKVFSPILEVGKSKPMWQLIRSPDNCFLAHRWLIFPVSWMLEGVRVLSGYFYENICPILRILPSSPNYLSPNTITSAILYVSGTQTMSPQLSPLAATDKPFF
jgi:hypothetical protein